MWGLLGKGFSMKQYKVLIVASSLILALSISAISQQQSKTTKQDPPPQKKQQDPIDDDQVLKLGTKLVNILFSAQDKQNRYFNDLQQTDVEIFEDGKPQEIFTFKRETDLPLTIAILVDVSGSEEQTIPLLKEAGGKFIDSILQKGKDTAAVVKFEGEATVMQSLTSNPARVRRGMDEIVYTPPPPVSVFGGPTPPINGGSRAGGTSLYDAIVATATDMLAKEPGRKTIILLTDGMDTTSYSKIGDAIDQSLRSEIVLYAVGIADPQFGVEKGVLNKLCDATGGRAVFPKSANELDKAFTQLEQDLRQQYLLAYEPKNETPDGNFRKIELRVKDKKDLKIKHRRGYYAAKDEQ